MWVSRDEWRGVMSRLERLEKRTMMGVTNQCLPDGEIVYESVRGKTPIDEVVSGIASAIGLRVIYRHAETEYVATKQDAKGSTKRK